MRARRPHPPSGWPDGSPYMSAAASRMTGSTGSPRSRRTAPEDAASAAPDGRFDIVVDAHRGQPAIRAALIDADYPNGPWFQLWVPKTCATCADAPSGRRRRDLLSSGVMRTR